MSDLEKLLNTKVNTDELKAQAFSDEQFEELSTKVAEYRKAALAGECHTKEQMKEIVVFFRMRRDKNFKEAPVKKTRAKAAPKVSRKAQLQAEADELLKNL